ncbi:MAG: SDR family NAD(P)-dependent oxidoreductase [Clostridiales bacterium]|nr:SDR family NAD(P)-dependent oxidoreductase [Clostridiales bacterium]
MGKLDGKIAMVTGGATGLGAAIVERFAYDGAKVACCYNKSADSARVLAQKLEKNGKLIHLVRMNLLESSEIRSAVDSIRDYFGHHIDILVNNAGDVFNHAPVDEMTEETWDNIIGINLKGTFLCCKYCLSEMKAAKYGRIINMSSISARSGGGPGASHYAASKGGVDAFTRALARECGPYNITVNAIAPGIVYTPVHERTNTPESLERLRQTIPLLRIGVPEEVSGMVSFLCSDDASYMTGAIIPINGGMRMD